MDKILAKVSLNRSMNSPAFESASPKRNSPMQRATSARSESPEPMSPASSFRATKEERREEALQLWKDWAADRLGQLPLEQGKQKDLSELEKKCAALARQAERRLELSASLRGGGLFSSGGGASTRKSLTQSLKASSSNQNIGWAVREIKKEKAYAAARILGESEREIGALNDSPVPTIPKSRALLDALITGKQQRPASASPYLSSSRASSRQSNRQIRRQEAADNNQPSSNSESVIALHHETDSLKNKLDEAHAAVETQSEVEKQLRETIDLLRARLHGQSQREVDHERRLQQHTRLEPLFDRLEENFSYSTPEQVIERLQLLEDDRLGTFDSLLSTQDEVSQLQSQLKAANQRVDEVRSQLETDHVRSSMTLQKQNDELRGELRSAEALNIKLQARQQQLVQLQTQVLHLWSKCQRDPLFLAANAPPEGEATNVRSGIISIGDTNPLSAIALVEEYVSAKSPALASKHYIDVSRVANRVWTNHLKHKPEVRGKVVDTFEQLSSLADNMARSILRSRKELEDSKTNEKELRESLERALREKRKLEAELQGYKMRTREGRGSSLLQAEASSSSGPLNHRVSRQQRPQSALVSSRIPSSPALIPTSHISPSASTPKGQNSSRSRPQSALVRSTNAKATAAVSSANSPQSYTIRERPPGQHWQSFEASK